MLPPYKAWLNYPFFFGVCEGLTGTLFFEKNCKYGWVDVELDASLCDSKRARLVL